MIHPFQNVPMRPVSRERLTDQTAAALREYVLANNLAPGTRLPAEAELARSLGVSRNVLRQAVASLQVLGMLRVAQGSGTYVADVADTDVFRQIAAWMGSAPVSERDYLEVRSIWERGIYALAIERAEPADLDTLDATATAMLETTDQGEADVLHREFHEGLLRSTGNTFLVTLGTILHRFFWEFGYLEGAVRKPPEPRLHSSHRAIVALLRSRDHDQIQNVIDLHLSPHVSADDHSGNASAGSQPASSKNREG